MLTFDYLAAADDEVNAVELEVPGVTAQALRDGLLADQTAREQLFGGSVTLDGPTLDRRARRRPTGPHVRRADRRESAPGRHRYGEREFVEEVRVDASTRYGGALVDLGAVPQLAFTDDDAGRQAIETIQRLARAGGRATIMRLMRRHRHGDADRARRPSGVHAR